MWQRTFWLFGSFLVVCTIPSKTEDSIDVLKHYINFLDEQDQKFVDMKNSRDNEMIRKRDWPGDEIDSHDFGCWRYCVKTKSSDGQTVNEESIKRVNIIWNVVDDPEVPLAEKTSNIWGIFSDQDKNLQWESSPISSEKLNIFYDNDLKCELSLEIGCRTEQLNSSFSSLFNPFSNDGQKELVSKSDGVNSTSTVFEVEKDIEKLRILAFGKLSQVVIGVPVAQGENNSPITRRTRPMFSLSRTSDAEGFVIDARNPSPGEWRLNLSGMENLKYNFTVTSAWSKKRTEYSNENNAPTTIAMPMNKPDEGDMRLSEMLFRPQRMAYPRAIGDDNLTKLKNEEKLRNETQNVERIASSGKALIFRSNETNLRKNANLETELSEPETNEKVNHPRINENAKILAGSELSELSRGIDELRKRTVVDIHPDTDLIVDPGVLHDVVFTVTNNQPLEIRHTFRGSSQLFPYVTVIPDEFWIRAGETINVAVRIQVPNLEQTEPNTVTLYVRGNENFEVVEKSTYVYVRSFDGRATTDNDKPSIDYSFNDNCAGKLNRDRCSRSRWSVEITVADTGSGLKRVTSVPNGVEPLTEFISGTKQKTIFYYSATCCSTTVDIRATDLQGNSYTQRLDVTAWDNLSPGEIAAIVLGSLLILLLLIFIVLALICCIRRRKSHDLSYSQRYGSRSPANAERSNF